MQNDNFFVITGGPGVGKTTLLQQLASLGYKTVTEDARKIIKNQIEINGDGLPWKDQRLYTQLMLEASIESFLSASICKDIVFFDRGILDAVGYASIIGMDISNEMNAVGRKYLYNKKVFILPPWKEIYITDNERKQTWDEAVETFTFMKNTYSAYNYELVEVPQDTVENRVRFIINSIKNNNTF